MRNAGEDKNEADERLAVLYDGACGMCSASVKFFQKRDTRGRLRFVARDTEEARGILARHGMSEENRPDSMIVEEGGKLFAYSTGTLRIVRKLKFPWRLMYGLVIVPRPMRDWGYRVIARNRKRFGGDAACELPRK